MKTILYLDDNEDDAMAIMRAFKNSDTKIKWVASAGAAFAELLCAAYDLIISDILMPGDDGLRFIREAAKRDVNIPIILTSGAESLRTFENYAGLKNYAGFILKPVTPEKIGALV